MNNDNPIAQQYDYDPSYLADHELYVQLQQQQPDQDDLQQQDQDPQDELQPQEEEPEDNSGAFANVAQGLTGQYKRMMMQYWQETINMIEREDHDFKNHQLPLARIKKVMKTDEAVRMISAEAPILFAKGCDIFITELTMRAWIHAEENKRRTLQKSDISAALQKSDMFDFLIDIVPRDEEKPKRHSTSSMMHSNSGLGGIGNPSTSVGNGSTTSSSPGANNNNNYNQSFYSELGGAPNGPISAASATEASVGNSGQPPVSSQQQPHQQQILNQHNSNHGLLASSSSQGEINNATIANNNNSSSTTSNFNPRNDHLASPKDISATQSKYNSYLQQFNNNPNAHNTSNTLNSLTNQTLSTQPPNNGMEDNSNINANNINNGTDNANVLIKQDNPENLPVLSEKDLSSAYLNQLYYPQGSQQQQQQQQPKAQTLQQQAAHSQPPEQLQQQQSHQQLPQLPQQPQASHDQKPFQQQHHPSFDEQQQQQQQPQIPPPSAQHSGSLGSGRGSVEEEAEAPSLDNSTTPMVGNGAGAGDLNGYNF